MAIFAQRLQVCRVICTAFAEFQHVVDMAVGQFHLSPTVAAPPAITFVDVLAEDVPKGDSYPPVPWEPAPWYLRNSEPHLASPHPAATRLVLTAPHIT